MTTTPTSTATTAGTSRRSAPTSSPGWSPAAKSGRCECRQEVRNLSDRVDASVQVLTDRLDDLLRDGARPAEPRVTAFNWEEYDRPTVGIPGLTALPEANSVQVKAEPQSPTTSDWDRLEDDLQTRQNRMDRVAMTSDDEEDDDNAAGTGRQVAKKRFASPTNYERR